MATKRGNFNLDPTFTQSHTEMIRLALSLLFRDEQAEDAKRWYSQGLAFSPSIPDVLLQKKGGPCGVLACLQAHVCMYMQFKNVTDPKEALVFSIWEILDRAARAPSSSPTATDQASPAVTICTSRRVASSFDPTEDLELKTFSDESQGKALIRTLVDTQWSSEQGVMLFVLSLILSRGPQRVRDDMDDPEALMTGQFGHCGQEMLNLILTGQAASQVHDGTVEIADSGMHLRGVSVRPNIGLLTRLEALRYCQVGSFLKNPVFPIWVVGSESHFTVLLSTDRDCDAKSVEQEVYERGKRAFTNRDRQENGFVKTEDLNGILMELGLTAQTDRDFRVMKSLIAKCEMPGSEGIVIWTTFWPVIGPVLRSGKGLAQVPDPAWACATCTFLNEDVEAKMCVVCFVARTLPPVQQQQQQQATLSSSAAKSPWICTVCTLRNEGTDDTCQACSASRSSQMEVEQTLKETESGGRTFQLVHVDGLEKTIGGKVFPPKKTTLKLTTVDPFLAGPGTSGFGSPFEEVLHTKWPGALFDYGPGGTAPSIVG